MGGVMHWVYGYLQDAGRIRASEYEDPVTREVFYQEFFLWTHIYTDCERYIMLVMFFLTAMGAFSAGNGWLWLSNVVTTLKACVFSYWTYFHLFGNFATPGLWCPILFGTFALVDFLRVCYAARKQCQGGSPASVWKNIKETWMMDAAEQSSEACEVNV